MSCRPFRAMAHDAVDDRLTPAERHALEAHHALCRECREQHAELLALRGWLGAAPAVEPPPDLLDATLFARVLDRPRGPIGELFAAARARVRVRAIVPAGATIALLLALAGLAPLPDEPPVAPPPSAREAGLLTVWDSTAHVIVASCDPHGIAGPPAAAPAPAPGSLAAAAGTGVDPGVHIFLFERIVVRG